jgi:hypothetical protein
MSKRSTQEMEGSLEKEEGKKISPRFSQVWEYFTESGSKRAKCHKCQEIIKTSGNTTNMISHLRSHGVYLFKKQQADPSQSKISFQKAKTTKEFYTMQDVRDRLCEWVYMESQPFTVVESEYLRRVFDCLRNLPK